jgi:hypothetical protein
MVSSGMLRRVARVRTDVSEELSASFIRVTRIGELGRTQAATSNRRTLRRLLVTAVTADYSQQNSISLRLLVSYAITCSLSLCKVYTQSKRREHHVFSTFSSLQAGR